MKEITAIILVLIAIYLLMAACLYLFQRKLIYFPVAPDPDFNAE
jgi:hypothetical protein